MIISMFFNSYRCFGLAAMAAGLVCLNAAKPAHAIEEVQAAEGPPFMIHILVSSRTDVCFDPGDVAAIKRLTLEEQERVNRRGGVSGRPVKVNFLDDARDEKKTIQNARAALADPQTLATIGLSSAVRAKAVFEAMGTEIANSGIPFLSDISVNSIFAPYQNVFTTRAAQDTDSVPVIAKFTQQIGFKRPAFVGLKQSVGGAAIGDGLKNLPGNGGLIADIRLGVDGDKIIPVEFTAAIAEIAEKKPDIIYLYAGGGNIPAFMTELKTAGVTPALFIGGRIDSLPGDVANTYPNAIYSLGWDNPPEVFKQRLRTRVTPDVAGEWIFEGGKISAAPGWSNNDCKPRPETGALPDPFTPANLRAINAGSQFADMVGLVAAAARRTDRTTDVGLLRQQVLKALGSTYAAGRGAYKGAFDNWSFVPSSRSAARNPFVIILPQGLGRTQLAPLQFVRSKDGSLRQMETLYADIDLIKAHRIDENEKTFFAEFYLSMRDSPAASIDNIEFSNAYLDAQKGGGRQIAVEAVHAGGVSAAYPDTMKIYKVSGRFLFDPDLTNYPFDAQRFSIDLQPKSGEAPFIVQPPPLELRDHLLISDGWDPNVQYVGYDEDFVPVVDAFTHNPSVVPFYKTSFAWIMQRQATDYFLRVAVPLGFILFVAYLSIFIPRSHFEAIVTIQVTALLSAVALYLSLPKLDSGTSTLSDSAFVFAYMILSIMIGISIARINPLIGDRRNVENALAIVHITAIPVFIAAAAYYVNTLSAAAG